MADLRHEATKRMRRRFYRPFEQPGWWNLFAIGITVVFVAFLGYQLVRGASTTQVFDADPPPGLEDITATTVGPGDEPATSTTAPRGTELVATADGSTTAVPSTATDTARRAGMAAFSGDASGLTLAEGATLPQLAPRSTIATAGNLQLLARGDDDWRFVVEVDPDANGPASPRTVTVTVARHEGSWTVAYS